ncbi:MAG: DUF3106 domain-containing protein [Thermoanaerobaculia bacterium]
MTCDELRERIVDPASASRGGHAPVVAHLEACAPCRAAARDYGALDRLVRPSAPPEHPADFEARLRLRLSAGPRRTFSNVSLLAGALAVLALAALVVSGVFRARTKLEPAPPASGPSLETGSAPAREAPPPDIVAVRSTPISLEATPLSAEEKSEAAGLHDFDFLNSFQTLARLDAFFPEPVGPQAPIPTPEGGFPSRPPTSPDALTGRFLDWQRVAKTERARLSALEQAFRNRPEEERSLLEDRWMLVRHFSESQRAGLRRLASRMDELDARAHDRLQSEIRLIGLLPKEQRMQRWRALPFSKPLTGQELESAEGLLISR